MIDKEATTISIEIDQSSNVKIQTLEKRGSIDRNKILSIDISLEVPKDEFSINKAHNTRMPYRHPNYNNHFIIQLINQRLNHYEKLSEYPIILKRSSSVEFYHFSNHRSRHHTVL